MNCSRVQSQDAPRRIICSLITPPLSAFHCQTRRSNSSRPRSWRLIPSFGEHALDDELRGDSGVVHAGEPESAMAAHAMPADEHVDLRVLEHVADVDRAGDVGWRQGDRKSRVAIVPEFSARKSFSSNQDLAQRASISCGS